MSFDSRETSLATGAPIRLYQFSRGVMRWLYCTADRDITLSTQIFKTVRGGIADDGIRQSGDPNVDVLNITGPADLEVAALYRGVPPSRAVALTIFDMHHSEPDVEIAWAGEIQSVSRPRLDQCRIVCSPLSARMTKQGLRHCWERACHRALYGVGCNVNRDLYRVNSTVQSMDGAKVSNGALASYGNGWFTAGWIEWSIGSGEYDTRMIERQVGGDLWLMGGTAGIELGSAIRVYAGCDQRIATCDSKFNNLNNYGGIAHLAGASPFDGNPVF
jgi:uncharacterized phage protein (TIGR02218 family)